MGKSLLVVESPTKAKTIARYLENNIAVMATVGHIKDLPERELGVDVENRFRPQYDVIPGKWKVIKELRSAAQKADAIYLAPDPDREGEAIAWHVAEELEKGKRVYRVLFHEITRNAVKKALENPVSLDKNKFDAQQARRILDRLVGYQISPILWRKVQRGLSAGRVQSVAVRLICEREEEIRLFRSEEYWTLDAVLEGAVPPPFRARLVRIRGKKPSIGTGEEASRIKEALDQARFRVLKVEKKRRNRNPPPPFITSTLQQEASRKYRFSPSKTMQIAQRLYEGIQLGQEGPQGLISYMRTDSTRISSEAVSEARSFIQQSYGKEYCTKVARIYPSKKGIQDAHEAIRPTSVARQPSTVKPFVSRDEFRLYELIWKRFVATQMAAAEFDQTTVEIEAGDCLFRATGSVQVFDGYLQLYAETVEADEQAKEEAEGALLPAVEEGEDLRKRELLAEQHFTQPPPRYTESSLIKELEEKGIGRPSTYASILSNIRDKHYVQLEDRKMFPTELGEIVNRLLIDSFPDILNVEFTANMEAFLDAVETGERDWVDLLEKFYGPFYEDLEKAKSDMADIRRAGSPTQIACDKCGKPMVIRYNGANAFLACSGFPECRNSKSFERDENGRIRVVEEPNEIGQECVLCGKPLEKKYGRFGPFLACTGFPKCRFTKSLADAVEGPGGNGSEELRFCEKCGGRLLLKRSRMGNRFWACENYPKCKEAKPYLLGVPCDRCQEGEFTERAGKRGRVFYCCSNYPKCRNSLRYRPVARKCEGCGAPYLLERTDVRGQTILFCNNKDCPNARGELSSSSPDEGGVKYAQGPRS
ncbi:MAG: type I DNA topoisomerase [bacterium]